MMMLFPSPVNCRTPAASPSSVPEPNPWYTMSKTASKFFAYEERRTHHTKGTSGSRDDWLPSPTSLSPLPKQSSILCTTWIASPIPHPWDHSPSGCVHILGTAPLSLQLSPTAHDKEVCLNTAQKENKAMRNTVAYTLYFSMARRVHASRFTSTLQFARIHIGSTHVLL